MVNLWSENITTIMEWISMILTALASGGLAGFGSLWYSRRKSKAEAVQVESEAAKSWQDIYQEMIEDLRGSRNEQQEQNNMLRDKVEELENRILKLKEEVEQNARKLAWLAPLTCCVKNCKDRIIFVDNHKPKRSSSSKKTIELPDCISHEDK